MIKSYKYFNTSDLSLATTLSFNFPIVEIDKNIPQKVQFYFKKNKSLDDFINKYWNGELRIEPQKFFNQLKVIKTRLYS